MKERLFNLSDLLISPRFVRAPLETFLYRIMHMENGIRERGQIRFNWLETLRLKLHSWEGKRQNSRKGVSLYFFRNSILVFLNVPIVGIPPLRERKELFSFLRRAGKWVSHFEQRETIRLTKHLFESSSLCCRRLRKGFFPAESAKIGSGTLSRFWVVNSGLGGKVFEWLFSGSIFVLMLPRLFLFENHAYQPWNVALRTLRSAT